MDKQIITNRWLLKNTLNSILEEICEIGWSQRRLWNNMFCSPYPNCLTQDQVGSQDTSECEESSLCDEETEVELWDWCYNIEETTYINPSSSSTNGQEIPPQIGQLINLTSISLGDKQLVGEIPLEIWNLTGLESLRLSNNDFK